MAFGFGFNKAKVLASAERNVKSGKLQQAIADYEKITKEEPKDLTVLNTIGDLYSRVGNTEQAVNYYRRVGDAFASSGFTVKAIAMYKKITKLDNTSLDSLNRLAELYVQQGLYTDARAQYALVAAQYLSASKLDEAARVYQKVLDLDPENSNMQAKLAEIFVKLGKKNEARDIYFRNAELHRSRGNLQAADDALNHVLAIDKTFSQAILLRGFVKTELGDAAGAIACLEQVPDIDSRPEGLRAILKSYLKLAKLDEAQPIARKLYTAFHETQALASFADALVPAGRALDAIAFYTEFADVLISTQGDAIGAALEHCISSVKENPTALEQLSGLMERAGQSTHLAEIKELLAHASVQCGDLAKARELYRDLARIEPDNPLHTQNYRQVLAKLGEDPSARPLSEEEASQPAMVDEIENSLPTLPAPEYSQEVADVVRAAVTDAELFDSYNLPGRAIAPLEAALPKAPQDPQVNQRLASLYARTSRYADAAARCRVLHDIYRQAGFGDQAREYGEMAEKFAARTDGAAPKTAFEVPAAATPAPAVAHTAAPSQTAPFEFEEFSGAAAGSVAEFEFAPTITPDSGAQAPEMAAFELSFDEEPAVAEMAIEEPAPFTVPKPAAAPVREAQPELVAAPAPPVPMAEFDLSAEWDMASDEVEIENDPAFDLPAPVAIEDRAPEAVAAVEPAAEEFVLVDDAGEPELESVPEPVVADDTAEPVLTSVHDVSAGEELNDTVEECRFYISHEMWDEAEAAAARVASMDARVAEELRVHLNTARTPEAVVAAPQLELPVADEPGVEAEPEVAHELAFELEPELVSEPEPVATQPEPIPLVFEHAAPVEELVASADPMESLFDLDSALGEDFEIAPPAPVHVEAPAIPLTMAAQAQTAVNSTASAPPVYGSTGAATAVALAPEPVVAPVVQTPAPAPPSESFNDSFADGALADIFAEFKSDMESATGPAEDPETHYNLGVAFKEMGLLDEAIGELQKVCQAIEQGHPFPQVLQAYTWLADCFVQKGVPEAAIRWYEKALRAPHVQSETATAIHYELATACELAGNRPAALAHFMEVYGANIDYRDVAERIKALKS